MRGGDMALACAWILCALGSCMRHDLHRAPRCAGNRAHNSPPPILGLLVIIYPKPRRVIASGNPLTVRTKLPCIF